MRRASQRQRFYENVMFALFYEGKELFFLYGCKNI
jgi:hypothetical protein